MENKTHWRKADKTDYLGACDIEEKVDLVLTIAKVELKEVNVRGKKSFERVATFKERGFKPMILNVTNAKVVKEFARNSVYLEEWKDIQVAIYVQDNVRLGSEITEGLRFRQFKPQMKATTKKELLATDELAFNNAVKGMIGGKTMEDIEVFYVVSDSVKQQLMNVVNESI